MKTLVLLSNAMLSAVAIFSAGGGFAAARVVAAGVDGIAGVVGGAGAYSPDAAPRNRKRQARIDVARIDCPDMAGSAHYCVNGGVCANMSPVTYCECPAGFYGSHCEFAGGLDSVDANIFDGVEPVMGDALSIAPDVIPLVPADEPTYTYDSASAPDVDVHEVESSVGFFCGKSPADAAASCWAPCPSGLHVECAEFGEDHGCFLVTSCVEDVDESDVFFHLPTPAPSVTATPAAVPSLAKERGERDVLVAFYEGAGGNDWKRNDNWASMDVGVCDWYGVRCDSPINDASVSHLRLRSNSMRGRLMPELFRGLPNLSVLDLEDNQLWGEIPEDVSGVPKLKSLTLAQNPLRGKIPSGLGRLPLLEKLDLTSNSFSWLGMPDDDSGYPSLRTLLLDGNYLRGTIPQGLFSMKSLETLSMGMNRLTGYIPTEFSSLTNLTRLRLDSNSLTGTLPNFVGLQGLEINITGNQLTAIDGRACLNAGWNGGGVGRYRCNGIACPVGTANFHGRQTSDSTPCDKCPSAKYIGSHSCVTDSPSPPPSPSVCRLQCRNGGTCTISYDGRRQWCACRPGYSGQLCESHSPFFYRPTPPPSAGTNARPPSHSPFFYRPTPPPSAGTNARPPSPHHTYTPTGYTYTPTEVPAPRSERDILVALYRGTGGNSWTRNDNWTSADVSICNWYGVECDSSLDNETVSRLELRSNSMRGMLMPDIFQGLPNLSVLDLEDNALWGSIPHDINSPWKLKSLTLARNPLKGPIPSSLGRLPLLEELDLRSNSFSYFQAPDNDGYPSLRTLLLDGNYLRGTIPRGLFFMKSLETLSLSENRLTGRIPSDFSFLTNLTKLNLHSNSLAGTLPNFAGLDELEINVTGNRLRGIDVGACLNGGWNNGDVGKYKCDGIACPVGTANFRGRQTSNSTLCDECLSAKYIGTLDCITSSPSPPPTPFVCNLECQNGGTCVRAWSSQVCRCPLGYSGKLCESRSPFYRPTPPPSVQPACAFYAVDGKGRLSTFESFCGGGRGYADLGPLSDFALDPITTRAIGLRESELFEFYLKDGSMRPEPLKLMLRDMEANPRFGAIEFAHGKLYGAGWIDLGNGDATQGGATLFEIDPATLKIGARGPMITTPIVGLAHWRIKRATTMYAVSSCEHKSNLYAIDLDTKSLSIVCLDMPACFESLAFHPHVDGGALYGGTADGCIARIIPERCSVLDCDTRFGWSSHLDNVTGLGVSCQTAPTPPPTFASTTAPTMYDPEYERESLQKFYRLTWGSNWVNNTGWTSEDKVDKCDWHGLECDDELSVTEIALPSNGLRQGGRRVWQYIEDLRNLKVLNLSNNELTGEMPSFEKLALLEVIDFGGNFIKGELQRNFVASAENLRRVDFSRNHLVGGLHSWSASVRRPTLKYLNFSSNDLGSSIPVELGLNAASLEVLDLSHNQFTFEFQESYYRGLRNLTSLRLSHNNLVGELPSFEGAYYPKLREVDVSHNYMKGEVSKNLFHGNQLTEYLHLDISFNDFGFIFPNLQLLEADDTVVTINAVGNQFEGLNESVCDNTHWNNGDLRFGCEGFMCPPMTFNPIGRQTSVDNTCSPCETAKFYGTTDCAGDTLLDFYKSTSGETWTRSDLWLSGVSVCEWFGVVCNAENKVSGLRLSFNALEGHLDTKLFAKMPLMESIILSGNALTSFDLCADCHPNLKVLDLRNNALSGTLPSFDGLPTLERVLLSDNSLSGTVARKIGLPNLKELDLSSNSISGMLVGFDGLPQLQFLNISRNDLTGTVAAEFMQSSFSNPAMTRESFYVDISFNSLQGILPAFEIDRLQIDVAGNMLSGLDQEIRDRISWNKRGVYRYGIEAIACPVGTGNAIGRQTSDSMCNPCPDAIYVGSVDCIDYAQPVTPTKCPASHRCQNGAMCVPSTTVYLGYFCDCKTASPTMIGIRYSGQFCEDLEQMEYSFVPTPTEAPGIEQSTLIPVEAISEFSSRPPSITPVAEKTPALVPATDGKPSSSEEPPMLTASKGSSKSPTFPVAKFSMEEDIYYPNFSNGLCVNDGKPPPDAPGKYLFHNVTECCDTYFPGNMKACRRASLPTASPTLLGEKNWYPDYANDICKNDGQHGLYEIHFAYTYEKCCEFELIDTEKCLEAGAPDDDGLEFSGDFASDARNATTSISMFLTASSLSMLFAWGLF